MRCLLLCAAVSACAPMPSSMPTPAPEPKADAPPSTTPLSRRTAEMNAYAADIEAKTAEILAVVKERRR